MIQAPKLEPRIIRYVNKIKHCRRVATRYDKLAGLVLESPDSSCGAAIMTRSIKGFKVDWGDRWRHSAWAERETAPKHMYWFEVSPALTVKLLHSSSPVEEDCLKATQAVQEFVEGHKNR